MARRRKKTQENRKTAWLITFSDLMTLLLTFFLLLVSMSVVDVRRAQTIVSNVSTALGMGPSITTPLGTGKDPKAVIPGVFELPEDELEPLREMLWEDQDEDLSLQSNRYVAIISIGADVLFKPGESVLSPKGEALLMRIVPALKNLNYPILLAGHTSPAREELRNYKVTLDPYEFSPTWEISFDRVMAVYSVFKSAGLSGDKVMVEAFGEYRPKVSNNTAPGRTVNRRVDIVLDRRDSAAGLPGGIKAPEKNPNVYEQKGFNFDVTPPPAEKGGE